MIKKLIKGFEFESIIILIVVLLFTVFYINKTHDYSSFVDRTNRGLNGKTVSSIEYIDAKC